MNDLIKKLESYNWVDELGHPLVNCVDWEELKKEIKDLISERDRYEDGYFNSISGWNS